MNLESKKCKKCKEEIQKSAQKCPKCGAYQSFPTWAIGLIVVVVVLIIGLILGNNLAQTKNSSNANNNANNTNENSSNNNQNNNNNETQNKPSNNQPSGGNQNKNVFGFNETFVFDNLEITIGSDYKFVTVNNRFSDYNNQTAVKLPITIKNIASETHGLNMFYYDVYGSLGTKAESLGAYFDENVDHAGDLRTNASYTKYMYFAYDGNGTYAIEFDDWSTKITVEFVIEK